MNPIYVGTLKDAEDYVKQLFVRVDASGEILGDYLKYGWTQQSLSTFLGTSTNFSNQGFLQSSCSSIRLIAAYPNTQLDGDMNLKQEALLTFEFTAQQNCPQVVCMYNYTSFIKIKNGTQELQKLYFINLLEQLGSGLQGSVHKAREQKTENWFAMKIINIINEEDRRKIQNEILLVRKIKSPNVIKIKEHFTSNDKAFIIMELGEKDLHKCLENPKFHLSYNEFQCIALQICNALKATHECGIMHRDLKPLNLVFFEENTIKLIDFGFAKECKQTSSVQGTPQYMAPEILNNERYTNSVDIFSLGRILQQLMKIIIFESNDEQQKQIFLQQMENMCLKMISNLPSERPSIDEIISIISVKYENRPIKDQTEFDILTYKQNQLHQILQPFVDNFILRAIEQNKGIQSIFRLKNRQIDTEVFKKICDIIIINHAHWGNNIEQIKSDIQFLFDNFSVKNLDDGKHFGVISNQLIQFQMHAAKYKGGKLKICDTMIFIDGNSFICPFINGLKFGITNYVQTNGESCVCFCKEGIRFGFGQYNFTNGDVYLGNFAYDMKNGRGVYKWVNGDIYDGDWKDDKRTGKGVLKQIKGNTFIGNYSYSGQYTGYESSPYQGVVYEGDFIDGKQTGKGVQKFENGNIYEGDFINNNQNGFGIFKKANGDVYEGQFVDGKRMGKGVFKWAEDGEVYDGDWKDGKRCGSGKCTFANGDVFQGQYYVKENELTNNGTYIYANGDIYNGWMKLDDDVRKRIRCGEGKLIKANGNILEGIWERDELKQSKVTILNMYNEDTKQYV